MASLEMRSRRRLPIATGKPGLVFEMQMGMIDRGAELGWISQYPHERECLFAPLVRHPPIPLAVPDLSLACSPRPH